VPVAEGQADIAMWWINKLRDGVLHAAAPTEAATKEYNESMKAAMPQMIWVTSWYLGKDGLPELFPGRRRPAASCWVGPKSRTWTWAPLENQDVPVRRA
jgi:hypothetical protein